MAERINWRDLPPVADPVEVPRRPSMTFLRHHDRCHRAGYLYLHYNRGAGAANLHRGDAMHLTIADLEREMVERNEPTTEPEIAKDRLNEVLSTYPAAIPAHERDTLRGLMHNWAVGWAIDPPNVVGIEQMLQLDIEVDGETWTVRGVVDLLTRAGSILTVDDYKSSFMPGADKWEQGGYDDHGNPRFGGDFQTQLYALLLAFGTTPDGLAIGAGVDHFRVRLVYPRHLREEGLAYREADIERIQLTDFMLDVKAQLRQLAENERTQKWQATPGDTHCDECPARGDCPLPGALLPDQGLGEIESMEDAETEAARWEYGRRMTELRKKRLKAFAERERLEEIRIGNDLALRFEFREGERLKNKAKLAMAIEGAVEYGHPFEIGDHFTYTQSNQFERRRVSRENDQGKTKEQK